MLTLVLAIAIGCVALVVLAAGTLAWRLTQGPLEITALAIRIVPLVAPGLTADHVTLALEHPDGERVLRLTVIDGQRPAEADQPAQTIRRASVAIAVSPLFTGHIAPEDISADGVRLHLARSLTGKSRPAGAPGADVQQMLSHLHHVAITDTQIWVADGALGQSWQVRDVAADLRRRDDGSIAGHAQVTAGIGAVSTTVTADGSYSAGGTQLEVTATPVSPAALARAVPQLAALQALDADVALRGSATLGPDLQVVRATVHAEAGPGVAQLPSKGGNTSPAPFQAMSLDAAGTPSQITLRALQLVLRSPSGAAPTTLGLSGNADRANGHFTAHLAVDMDHAEFADLPSLWPEGVGGNARAWLTENITAGTAHDAHFTFTLTGDETGDNVALTEAGGTLTGDDVTTWWLRPVPPLEHGHTVVTWQNPDTLLIAGITARQGTLNATNGSVKIVGLTVKDQVATINTDIGGPLADLLTLLRNPRLKLLSTHPVPFTAPLGTIAAHLAINLPLDSKVSVDQVQIHANGQLANVHLGSIVAGRDLDRGQLALDVTNDGLSISGPAQLDHMPGKMAVDMDFRTGPPSQVLQHAAVTLRIAPRDAKAAGIGVIGLDAGTMSTTVDYSERRDGGATIRLSGDLRDAGFTSPIGWSKTAGTPGNFNGQALLQNGKLVGLEGLHAEAPNLSIQARSDMVNGKPAVVHLERADIGRSSATGTITLPQHNDDPYRVVLSGPRLDLEGRLTSQNAPAVSDQPPPASSQPGTPYAVDLRFQQVILGPGHALSAVALNASGAGSRIANARLTTGGAEKVQADLVTQGSSRKVWATAADLGLLLRNTDLAGEVTGGALVLDGAFDDRLPNSPFSGTVELGGFSVRGAPVVGKVLQGMTLYGLVDALRGPGLVFDRLHAPFHLDGSVLDLDDARAYSSSLGVTATGRMDFGHKQIDLKGTIVPAYFFNSLPGRVPLLGRLFSPEKGGGVFAATFGLKGKIDDPSVSLNPLSALTPGFTRRLFNLFD
ncbi:AsmA-like C-terminal region-containing protein [Acidisphaera sp. L21]|uniref:YhdP family protein n=1 Tax=Acidisphaera sp. L21 TaxID=1641851 RepID=UPI00131E1B6F|nr:AsmA-like C-terminal region-containing protein [Acidisphaera sp. L21]